jgi:hypothetical protein
MREPAPPQRTTVTWEMSQAWRRSRVWRFFARLNERITNRYKITQRFPVATAVLAWVLAVGAATLIYFVMLLLSNVE